MSVHAMVQQVQTALQNRLLQLHYRLQNSAILPSNLLDAHDLYFVYISVTTRANAGAKG
jgi:hypothetical protein